MTKAILMDNENEKEKYVDAYAKKHGVVTVTLASGESIEAKQCVLLMCGTTLKDKDGKVVEITDLSSIRTVMHGAMQIIDLASFQQACTKAITREIQNTIKSLEEEEIVDDGIH